MFGDLRQFLDVLKREGDLLTVEETLSPAYEIAAAIREVEEKTGKVLYLLAVKGYPFSLVGNLLGQRRRIGLAFDNPENPLAVYSERRHRLLPPVSVTDGPVREVVHRDAIELSRLLPALIHHEGDVGPYLTSALVVARDPATGKQSCGIHRVQLKGGDKIGILLNNPPIAAFFRKAEDLSRPLPIALVIGCDPVTFLSSAIRAPEDDKFAIGGALAARPIEVIRCMSSDLEVPAYAELVLEGEILPGVRETEGPFGESSGYYMAFESPVGHISVVTHRKDAIYHALMPFSSEDSTLMQFLWEAETFPGLKARFPFLVRVYFPLRTLGLSVFAAVEPTSRDKVKALIEALWETIPIAKNIVVVDEDVPLESREELWWALSTRARGEDGIWIGQGARKMAIDPAGQAGPVSRMAIDATALFSDPARFRRVDIAPEVRERVRRLLEKSF